MGKLRKQFSGKFQKDIALEAIRERSVFIGKEKYNESGLGDFGVRKYDFLAGRFTSPDAMWEKLAFVFRFPNFELGI